MCEEIDYEVVLGVAVPERVRDEFDMRSTLYALKRIKSWFVLRICPIIVLMECAQFLSMKYR